MGMSKRVKVVTKCGDEHFYDFDQEVKSVEVVKEVTVISSITLDALAKAFNSMTDYSVTLERKDGNIVIVPCGVGEHIWSHIVKQDWT